LDFARYPQSHDTSAQSVDRACGALRPAQIAGFLASLLVVAGLLLSAVKAQAFPPLKITTNGNSVQWSSLESEWGYRIAVSNLPRLTEHRVTDYFEQAVTANPQTYTPNAKALDFTPIKGKVFVGIGPLSSPSTSPEEWSTNEVEVTPTGLTLEPPTALTLSADSESISWTSVDNGEWGYEIAVSNLPRNTEGRITKYYWQALGADPQSFKPDPTKLPFIPAKEKVFVGVGAVASSGESAASWTASEAILRIPEEVSPVEEPHKPEPPQPPLNTPSRPLNTSPPSTSGTAIVGNDLTASLGAWQGEPTSYTYEWQLCNEQGSACNNISGATGATLTLTSGYVGHRLRAVVIAGNAGGNTAAVSMPSAEVGARVGASMEWTFGWSTTGSWTKVQSLQVLGIPPGGVVEVVCRGHGCPFASRRVTPGAQRTSCRSRRCGHANPATHVDLAHLFKGRHLPGGLVISVRVVKAGWVGRLYTFTLRAGRNPLHTQTCLAPNSTQPTHC